MPSHRQLVGRTTVGLLLIVMAAACSVIGYGDLHIAIENDGPKEVAVTVDMYGPGMPRGGRECRSWGRGGVERADHVHVGSQG